MSEFSVFGPGVTNYFKFLKFCVWLFVVLTVISLPILIVNISGSNIPPEGLTDLAATTVGNLGGVLINGTQNVLIPGCDGRIFGAQNCYLDRSRLGTFYVSLDMLASLCILLAFAWLYVFESKEEQTLDDNIWFTSR